MKLDKVKITIEKDTESPDSFGWAMDIQMAVEMPDGKGKYIQDSVTASSFEALIESTPKFVMGLLNA